MKKLISVVLSIVLIAIMVPFAVNAAGEYTYNSSGDFDVADFNTRKEAGTNNFYIGEEGTSGAVSIVLNASDSITIPSDVKLIVRQGSVLTVNGMISNYGTIDCYGRITVTDGSITNYKAIDVKVTPLADGKEVPGVLGIHKDYGLVNASSGTVKVDGTLDVMGGLVMTHGSIEVSGKLVNGIDGIVVADTGSCLCYVNFNDLNSFGLYRGITNPESPRIVEVSYYASNSKNPYIDVSPSFTESDYDRINVDTVDKGIRVPLGTYLYIKVALVEEETTDKYDDSKFPVYCNGIPLVFGTVGYSYYVTTAAEVTYAQWKTNSEELYKNTYKILLPEGEGYTVYSRNGETGTLEAKWGSSLAFKIEVDEEYDQSAYEVYVYDGYGWMGSATSELFDSIDPYEPDQYGFYNLGNIRGDHTIYVVGIMKNETINMVGNILDTLKNVFNMFMELFQQFMAFFQNMG